MLTVLPGTLGADELTERLRGTGAAAVMKIGRSYPGVRAALKDAGRLEEAYYVERASRDPGRSSSGRRTSTRRRCRTCRWSSSPGRRRPGSPRRLRPRPQPAGSAGRSATAGDGRVDVVGLGPGGRDWLTPQAAAVLAAADDLVGYGPYVDRVPLNPRQRRHGSDNRVEAQRAEFALDLALRGRRVAVVSSGDPGVFAMASVVLEAAAADPRFAAVPVAIVPGMTAAQAVASLAGAPLGHDYVMLSLSDRLKPWDVIARRLRAAAEGRLRDRDLQPRVAVSAAAAGRRARPAARAPCRRTRRS